MDSFDVHSQRGIYQVHFQSLKEMSFNEFTPVIDKKVWQLYRNEGFFKNLENPILLEISEEGKTLETIQQLSQQLIERNLGRDLHLLAVGGGITQELVSFTASIYFRGVQWSFVPTTLLSQADSCLGGKNSLNIEGYKNILGTFYPPKGIYISNQFLSTLDTVQIQSGLLEMLKIHLLSGKAEFEKIGKLSSQDYLYNSLKLKKIIIEKDEMDQGERWKLNLGHTLGHALEASSLSPIPHGIAVGYGILWGLELSKKRNILSDLDYLEIKNLLKSSLDNYLLPAIDQSKFIEAILRDKKNSSQEVTFILCTEPGEVCLVKFPNKEIENTLKFIFE